MRRLHKIIQIHILCLLTKIAEREFLTVVHFPTEQIFSVLYNTYHEYT